MKKFRVDYKIKFVNGTLRGLEHDTFLVYPEGCREWIDKSFGRDVREPRVLRGSVSHYQIVRYTITPL